jgi:hypothetical protein
MASDENTTAYPDLQRVINYLDNALQAFAEGDSVRGCQLLDEADCVFSSALVIPVEQEEETELSISAVA